jgi:hypothetical protein
MATASTVRISDSAHRVLRDLAHRESVPMQTLLDRAIEDYRRTKFLDAVNQSFANLCSDPSGWADEVSERQKWNSTTRDGIEND